MMLAALLKKQLFEINQSFFINRKTGKERSQASSITLIVFYAILMVFIIGGMFTVLAIGICKPMNDSGMAWVYFTMFRLIAVAMGVFGSVFNTYSGLYLAKDNDLLLSLPIPVGKLVLSRLLGVFVMGFMFSEVVIVPAIAVYAIVAPFGIHTLTGALTTFLTVPMEVLALSCVFGWVIAKISVKLKNRSFITVVISIVAFAAYYMLYFQANRIIASLVRNSGAIGNGIMKYAYPLYVTGLSGTGDIPSVLSVVLMTAAVCALTYLVLSKSFIKIATSSGGTAKVKEKKNSETRVKSPFGALLGKEFRRFASSPTYMLNCGFGTVFLVVAAVFAAIKGGALAGIAAEEFEGFDILPVAVGIAVCLLSTMNDTTAPSVSLEGKNIWVLQSLPVDCRTVLRAKLAMQLILTALPVTLCVLSAGIFMRLGTASTLLVLLFSLSFTLLSACFGLYMNLRAPNLTWQSEITPIKQSLSTFVTLFGGWVYVILTAVALFALTTVVSSAAGLAILTAVNAGVAFVLYRWINVRGSAVFAKL